MGLSNLPPGVTDRMIEEQAGNGEAPVDALIRDICQSYETAMRAAGIGETVIEEISTTVADAITNNVDFTPFE